MRSPVVRTLSTVACSLVCAAAGMAQLGPGLPKRTYLQSELFRPISRLDNGGLHGHSLVINGYLALVRHTPGGVDFSDISDPYAPARVTTYRSPSLDLCQPNTQAMTRGLGGLVDVINCPTWSAASGLLLYGLEVEENQGRHQLLLFFRTIGIDGIHA